MAGHSFRDWLSEAPPGTLLPAADVLSRLESEGSAVTTSSSVAPTWRERFWTCPAETRLGVVELCEAIGRPKSWVHRHTSRKAGVSLIPHRKLDGALVFVAGEVRAWLNLQEERCVESRAPRETGKCRPLPSIVRRVV